MFKTIILALILCSFFVLANFNTERPEQPCLSEILKTQSEALSTLTKQFSIVNSEKEQILLRAHSLKTEIELLKESNNEKERFSKYLMDYIRKQDTVLKLAIKQLNENRELANILNNLLKRIPILRLP